MSERNTQHKPEQQFRQLYAHWLDGEWQKVAFPMVVEAPFRSIQEIAEAWLKLSALFGARFSISDVQLIDSTILLHLFAKKEFREYLKRDSNFLTLAAHRRKGISDERTAVATRGLERPFQQGWTSSVPGFTQKLVQQFADTVLAHDKLDTGKLLRDKSSGPGLFIQNHPECDAPLTGLLYGICHFAKARTSKGGRHYVPTSTPRSYIDVITDALNAGKMPSDTLVTLEEVWRSVKSLVPDEEARNRRSVLQGALESREPDRHKWPPQFHTIWNTVVHAWNSNVCDTVQATGASIAPLPSGAVVPYRGEIVDVTGPFVQKGHTIQQKLLNKYFPVGIDVQSLKWSTVADLADDLEEQRYRFQKALFAREESEIYAAGDDLANELASRLRPNYSTVVPERFWSYVGVLSMLLPWGTAITDKAEKLDNFQRRLREDIQEKAILNTLHTVRNDVIAAFSTGDSHDGR
jgi:hypothetical protein